MLSPSQERLQRLRVVNTNTGPGMKQWHQFLDNLAWLSDHQGSGKSVTSIAAEHNPSRCVFWLASNSGVGSAVLKHIRNILDILQEVASGSKDSANAHAQICAESIAFSKKRVNSYRDRLFPILERCKSLQRQDKGRTSSEHWLFSCLILAANVATRKDALDDYMEQLLESRANDTRLCSAAYQLRGSRASAVLSDLISIPEQASAWAALRHYVGRLGSWHVASLVLTSTASQVPDLFKNAKAQTVPFRDLEGQTFQSDQRALDNALGRLFLHTSEKTPQQVRSSLQTSTKCDVGEIFAELFRCRYSKPCLHAEIAVLEHFYRRSRHFVNDDRYIGCSKPSCYCCYLFCRLHPLQVLPRPCHGITWPKWSFPPLPDDSSDVSTARQYLMRAMLDEMTRDLLTDLSSQSRPSLSWPESTTGIGNTRTWMQKEPNTRRKKLKSKLV